MDFGTLLRTARDNEYNKKEVRYYSTKFAPPKKEEKKATTLSANIQKFLARKEAEEKRKAVEVKKKREDLLALRSQDKKATRRVNVMLKRTKSANQSVIEDAVDNDNTAVTLVGPQQPDEDDYGYVSQEASAFYNKMMEKYSKMPDDPKFSTCKRKASFNLNNTKDRVKAALEREREEALLPHKRKKRHVDQESEATSSYKREEEEDSDEVVVAKPKPRISAPPPINFSDLLKLAEKKQHEPIMIEVKPKDDEGPLMTKKQKKEFDRFQQWKDSKKNRQLGQPVEIQENINSRPLPVQKQKHNIENSQLSKSSISSKSAIVGLGNTNKSKLSKDIQSNKQSIQRNLLHDQKNVKPELSSNKLDNSRQKLPSSNLLPKKKLPINSELNKKHGKLKTLDKKSASSSLSNHTTSKPIAKQNGSVHHTVNNVSQSKTLQPTKKIPASNQTSKPMVGKDLKPKLQSSDLKSKQLLSNLKPKQFPSPDLKPKQFPSPDLKPKHSLPPVMKEREFPPRDMKKKPVMNKRKILDDEEYDPEMDDFIDDGPEEMEDYSKYIKDIFGYDKSKYRGIDDDIDNMESTFAQQMREDVRSTKLGIMEDLEDMQREKEEKQKKMLMKKKRKL